jgi:DNA-binding response OmpR family regulator
MQSTKVVDVAICRLNKRLKEHGLRIRNLRGVGFYFNAEDKSLIKKLLSV